MRMESLMILHTHGEMITITAKYVESIYPQELRDLYYLPTSDRNNVQRWFMSFCRCGEAAAKMYSTFYLLLLDSTVRDIEVKSKPTKPEKARTAQPKQRLQQNSNLSIPTEDKPQTSPEPHRQNQPAANLPQLHINIQLHISPDSTAEQIDKIFESMSRHLKEFK